MRIVWQTVRTITKEILGVKGLSKHRHHDKFVRKDKHSGLGCSELVWDTSQPRLSVKFDYRSESFKKFS